MARSTIPHTVLARLDFVIGSVHSRFNMNAEEMTARVLRALDDPRLTILGHPTGRLLLSRDPYPLDMDAQSSSGPRRAAWRSRSTPTRTGSTSTGGSCLP